LTQIWPQNTPKFYANLKLKLKPIFKKDLKVNSSYRGHLGIGFGFAFDFVMKMKLKDQFPT
jgi:hypothetical protein